MNNKTLYTSRLRLRRMFRRRKRVVEIAAIQAENNLERHFFKRLGSLAEVRRFVVGWVGLLLLLTGSVAVQARSLGQFYQRIAPSEGGTLREGVVGGFSDANPLYASNAADSSVAKLVFSGLFTYDDKNKLVSDLADKWETDDKGQEYKVVLRRNVKWHDGKPFTADDVLFTYKTIQNPDAKSPLFSSWKGIEISKIDKYTVHFVLPSPLAAFPYSLTNGIVPKHLLSSVPATQLRSIPFNTSSPVGTGPFKWKSVQVLGSTRENRTEIITLNRNQAYYHGEPKIAQYELHTYRDETALTKAFERKELTTMVGVSKLNDSMASDQTVRSYNVPLTGSVMAFYNMSGNILQDVQVRKALTSALDRSEALAALGFPAIAAQQPFLKGQVGFDGTLGQRGYSLEEAKQLLDTAGWKPKQGSPYRVNKDGQELILHFATQNISEYAELAQNMQKQWRALGVNLDVKLYSEEDMQSSVLTQHNYDILLYGITIGPDPDVFAYWHSSQADVRSNRLNFSEYKNKNADKALEAGRTRTDPAVRALKYKPFLQSWQSDIPAVALYQPRFLYIARSDLVGFSAERINSVVDRLNGIEKWTVLRDRIIK